MSGDSAGLQDYAVAIVVLALFLTALTQWIYNSLRWHPPLTVTLFALGFFIASLHNELGGGLGDAIRAVHSLHPHVILFVLLPPLLFHSASSVNFHVFQEVSVSSILLAGPGVIICVLFIGSFVRLLYGWFWSTSFLLATVLSATDPVAVVSILHDLGAPEQFATLVEGESLLNDGAAYVIFVILKHVAVNAEFHVGWSLGQFLVLGVGGVVWGLVASHLTTCWLYLCREHAELEVTIMLMAVYTTFFLAEVVLSASGVLAVVVLGLFMSNRGRFAVSRRVLPFLKKLWGQVAYISNGIIFVLAGMVAEEQLFETNDLTSTPALWGSLFAIYVVIHIARAIMIAVLWYPLHHLGYGISQRETIILNMAGLRGAVSLALSLLIGEEEGLDADTRAIMHFHIAGVVCLTTLVNGSLAEPLYKALHVFPDAHYYLRELTTHALAAVTTETSACKERLLVHWFYKDTSWGRVDRILPEWHKKKIKPHGITCPLTDLYTIFAEEDQKVVEAFGVSSPRVQFDDDVASPEDYNDALKAMTTVSAADFTGLLRLQTSVMSIHRKRSHMYMSLFNAMESHYEFAYSHENLCGDALINLTDALGEGKDFVLRVEAEIDDHSVGLSVDPFSEALEVQWRQLSVVEVNGRLDKTMLWLRDKIPKRFFDWYYFNHLIVVAETLIAFEEQLAAYSAKARHLLRKEFARTCPHEVQIIKTLLASKILLLEQRRQLERLSEHGLLSTHASTHLARILNKRIDAVQRFHPITLCRKDAMEEEFGELLTASSSHGADSEDEDRSSEDVEGDLDSKRGNATPASVSSLPSLKLLDVGPSNPSGYA